MKLSTNDGIRCDRCGAELKITFEYYSDKRTRVKVDISKFQTSPVEVDNDIVDFDLCPECHKEDVEKLRNQETHNE